MKQITTIILMFLVLVVSAGAQEIVQQDIIIDNLQMRAITTEVEINPCEEAQFFFDITNTGTFQDTFDLGVDPFAEYAVFNMNPVTLLPGETKRIVLTTIPECNIHGDFDVYFLAQSRWSGEIFESKNTLTINPTDIPVIAPGIKKIQVDYGKNFVEIPIENLGGRETTYLLSIEGDDWVSIEPEEITVPAHATKNFRVITDIDNSTKQGQYDIFIVANVTETGIEYAKNIKIKIKSPTFIDDLFSIYLHFTIGAIILIVILVVVFFKTRKWLRDTKEIRADKKRLRQEEKKLRVLEKAEKKQLQFEEKIKKKKEKELAKQAKLQAKEERKTEKSTTNYEVIKEKVKFILTKTFSKENKLIPLETVKKSKKLMVWLIALLVIIVIVIITFLMRNKIKQYTSSFILGIAIAIILYGAVNLFIYLKRKRLINKLNPKDLEEIKASVKEEFTLNYKIISKQALKKIKVKVKWIRPTIALVIFAAITIAGYFTKSYLGKYPAMFISLAGLVLFVLTILIIVVKLKTSRKQEVELGAISPNKPQHVVVNWKKGLGEFMFRLKNNVESALLAIKHSKQQPTFMSPKGRVYQFFEVEKVNITDRDIDKVSFRFKVKKSWMNRNKIAADQISLMRYTSNKWIKHQKIDIVAETAKFIFYEAVHPSFSHFAIVGKEMTIKLPSAEQELRRYEREFTREKKKARKVKKFSGINKTAIGWILIALAVVWAGIYMIYAYSSVPTLETDLTDDLNDIGREIEKLTNEIAGIETVTGGIPAQVWQENQPLELDLGRYFSDPDGDALAYSNSPTNHVTITYEGTTALITPNPNWAGEEVIVFTATDAKGSSVSSNPVSLAVKRSPSKQAASNFFSDYGWNILLGVVALIIIIVAVEARKRIISSEI